MLFVHSTSSETCYVNSHLTLVIENGDLNPNLGTSVKMFVIKRFNGRW